MARARNLTCGTIAALPVTAMRGPDPVVTQPYWAYGTDGQLGSLTVDQRRKWGVTPQTPYHRALWTVDDLLFCGQSLWLVTDRLASKFPSRMVRVPFDHWELTPTPGGDLTPIRSQRMTWSGSPAPTRGAVARASRLGWPTT
jgi:hypothetical protein